LSDSKQGRPKGFRGHVPSLAAGSQRPAAVPPKLKEMRNQEATVGQTVVLRCEASTEYPSLKFKWFKNGKEITKKNRPENIKIPKKQKKSSELRISGALLADAGEYTCKVNNKIGNDSTKARIVITDPNGKTWLILSLGHVILASSSLMVSLSPIDTGTLELIHSSWCSG
uniref:Ig-like domain-containing protein n=1 Tax=Sphenodon punctatus TaxID=8508 RepID=A0A8D0GXE9_SPHPU